MNKSKQKLNRLVKECDNLWRDLLLEKYNYICEVCGSKAHTVHHFILKAQSLNTRWNLSNGIPICSSCHTKIHLAQDASIVVTIKDQRGQRWYDNLQQERHKIFKKTLYNLQQVKEKLGTIKS